MSCVSMDCRPLIFARMAAGVSSCKLYLVVKVRTDGEDKMCGVEAYLRELSSCAAKFAMTLSENLRPSIFARIWMTLALASRVYAMFGYTLTKKIDAKNYL